jgi:hypothetical protein
MEKLVTPMYIASFSATFLDGFSFRHIFDYLKSFNNECDFILTPSYMRIEQCDYTSTVFNVIDIKASNLLEYKFDSGTNDINEIYFRLNLHDTNNMFKMVLKKEGLRIYKFANSNELHFQIISHTNYSNTDHGIVKLQEITERLVYELPTYTVPESNPSVKTQTLRIVKICKTISQVKTSKAKLIIYPNGIRFEAKMDGDIIVINDEIGQCGGLVIVGESGGKLKLVRKIDTSELMVLEIKTSILKSLSKIGDLVSSYGSIVKVFIEKDLPLKILSNVGVYGKLRVYLRSNME